MRNRKLISVIIPNFNNESYIEGCLLSVLAQTYRYLEVIVIDDCSTDRSPEIIKHYAHEDKRILPIFNRMNVGVAQNRHWGIMKAQGDFITTLDSDDIFLSDYKLEKELELFQHKEEEGKGNTIIFSGIVLIDPKGLRLGQLSSKAKEGFLLNEIIARTCMIPRDFLFTRRQYEEAGGFDTSIPIYEDWDLKIRMARNNLFFFTGIEGIGYRRHGQGLSATMPARHTWWLSKIFIKNFHLIETERVRTTWMFFLFLMNLYRTHLKKRFRGRFR